MKTEGEEKDINQDREEEKEKSEDCDD